MRKYIECRSICLVLLIVTHCPYLWFCESVEPMRKLCLLYLSHTLSVCTKTFSFLHTWHNLLRLWISQQSSMRKSTSSGNSVNEIRPLFLQFSCPVPVTSQFVARVCETDISGLPDVLSAMASARIEPQITTYKVETAIACNFHFNYRFTGNISKCQNVWWNLVSHFVYKH